jgi:hypothetical protein
MAVRPVFFATDSGNSFVDVRLVEFEWIPGMAKTQKQKSIDSLHSSISGLGEYSVLEVSSKSRDQLGIELSAFNLGFIHQKNGKFITVESAFQGSKVFERGGPFPELYSENARDAKTFFKEKNMGNLTDFVFFGQNWPIKPFTLFYDWVYLNCLKKSEDLSRAIREYDCFTDIEFNPKLSINCQAYSAALFVSLSRRGIIDDILSSREEYIRTVQQQPDWIKKTDYVKFHKEGHPKLI